MGAVFASLIYAVSVISMPMILHRQTDAITAGLTSMRLVLTQTGVMLWWAALIAVVVGLALLAGFFLNADATYRWAYLIGIVPLATGLLSSCPLYSILGLSTCPMKRS